MMCRRWVQKQQAVGQSSWVKSCCLRARARCTARRRGRGALQEFVFSLKAVQSTRRQSLVGCIGQTAMGVSLYPICFDVRLLLLPTASMPCFDQPGQAAWGRISKIDDGQTSSEDPPGTTRPRRGYFSCFAGPSRHDRQVYAASTKTPL